MEGYNNLNQFILGKVTEYVSEYSPDLLQGVPRALGRDQLKVLKEPKFFGVDVWHGYELSWLNLKGKPEVALLRCEVPATTPKIIESKSFKLYLNSLNQTKFESQESLKATLKKDLSSVAEGNISIELLSANDETVLPNTPLPGDCIDSIDIEINDYELDQSLLKVGEHLVSESLNSHLLKSNCLITNQPDWASVVIKYKGRQIDRESLLRYLISFRQHNEFHEQCVERLFTDISRRCEPEKLSVQALYTRRGGLDICPFRSSEDLIAPQLRVNRQ